VVEVAEVVMQLDRTAVGGYGGGVLTEVAVDVAEAVERERGAVWVVDFLAQPQ
jgi:hypothetical protein